MVFDTLRAPAAADLHSQPTSFKIGYHAFCFLPQGALGPQEAGSGHYTHVFLFFVFGGRALMLIPLKASERGPTYQYINPGPPSAQRRAVCWRFECSKNK